MGAGGSLHEAESSCCSNNDGGGEERKARRVIYEKQRSVSAACRCKKVLPLGQCFGSPTTRSLQLCCQLEALESRAASSKSSSLKQAGLLITGRLRRIHFLSSTNLRVPEFSACYSLATFQALLPFPLQHEQPTGHFHYVVGLRSLPLDGERSTRLACHLIALAGIVLYLGTKRQYSVRSPLV